MMPHIVESIREDHVRVLHLLDILEQTGEGREERYATVKHELQGHMHGEEATLYRRMERVMQDEIEQSVRDHTGFREIFGRLDRMPPDRDAWLVHLRELQRRVWEHIEHEETVLEEALSVMDTPELYEMGDYFQQAKRAMIQMASGRHP
ncbi:hemerythrin domain-containing protein [Methanoculleus frigidifontis]|nr:hemerythrin domain-containing protein [Methanoculleus sp. FWC-SCC1]